MIHQTHPTLFAGEPLDKAKAAMIMIHGRGSTAQDILSLSHEFAQTGFAYIAPQADDGTWYPNRFLAPIESNEPYLSSALKVIDDLLTQIKTVGISPERTMLLGFSQGACLTLEYVARHAQRYGGVAGLSGALIGPDGMKRNDSGSLDGTPVFLGCSDVDFHVPKERVESTASTLKSLGANVTMRLYPNMDHAVNEDEIEIVREMMKIL